MYHKLTLVASLALGMERLIQYGFDYNTANAPEKVKAVVNLSIGTNGKSDILDRAVKDLTRIGYVVVIAAGDNGGECLPMSLASCPFSFHIIWLTIHFLHVFYYHLFYLTTTLLRQRLSLQSVPSKRNYSRGPRRRFARKWC